MSAVAEQSPPADAVEASDAEVAFEPTFPVESFREAAAHLRRPFTPRAVKFKVQATWPKADPKTALIVSYIDARLVVERLNLVCPHLWHDTYESVAGSSRLLCRLTVDGITRPDVGDGYQGKGLYSDALKRAAVKFGVGVSLYAVPKIQLTVGDKHVEQRKAKDGKTLVLSTAGEQRCRDIYEAWLESAGTGAFGETLDHGDAEGAVGDPEEVADAAEPDEADAASPPPAGQKLAGTVVDRAWELGVQQFLQLAASRQAGADVGDCSTKTKAKKALAKLSIEQLEGLNDRLSKKVEQQGAKEEAPDA